MLFKQISCLHKVSRCNLQRPLFDGKNALSNIESWHNQMTFQLSPYPIPMFSLCSLPHQGWTWHNRNKRRGWSQRWQGELSKTIFFQEGDCWMQLLPRLCLGRGNSGAWGADRKHREPGATRKYTMNELILKVIHKEIQTTALNLKNQKTLFWICAGISCCQVMYLKNTKGWKQK